MTSTIARTDLTEWYPADVKPVREGVYECRSFDVRQSAFKGIWDGERWCLIEFPGMPFTFQRRQWRGLKAEA